MQRPSSYSNVVYTRPVTIQLTGVDRSPPLSLPLYPSIRVGPTASPVTVTFEYQVDAPVNGMNAEPLPIASQMTSATVGIFFSPH